MKVYFGESDTLYHCDECQEWVGRKLIVGYHVSLPDGTQNVFVRCRDHPGAEQATLVDLAGYIAPLDGSYTIQPL